MQWLNYARFGARMFRKAGPPLHLTVFVTAKCNAVCRTCFYWDSLNKAKNELALEEYEKIARSLPSLLWLAYTGGEPFLRKDIAEISAAFYRHTRPGVVSINTNGIKTKDIVERAAGVCRAMPETFVGILVSIDALGERHDKIRGVPGNFVRAIETFRSLQAIKKEHPNLGVGISTCYCAENQDMMDAMYDFVVGELRPDNWDLSFIRGKPMDTSLAQADLDGYVSVKRRIEASFAGGKIRYYNEMPLSTYVHAKERASFRTQLDTLRGGGYQSPCYAGALSCVLLEEGDVYPCEMLDRKLGNVRDHDYDLMRIWDAKEAVETRRFIRDEKCFCTHECNLSINHLFNPALQPKILGQMVRQAVPSLENDSSSFARPGPAIETGERGHAATRLITTESPIGVPSAQA